MWYSLPKQAIEKPREVAHEEDEPNVLEKDKEEAHNNRQLIRKLAGRHLKNTSEAKTEIAPPLRLDTSLAVAKDAVSTTG
jgi:hypothetical protein